MRILLLFVFLTSAFILNWGLTRLITFGSPEQARPVARNLALLPSGLLLLILLGDRYPSLLVGMIVGICLCDAAGAWLNVFYQGARE
ncbi:hypothetical protein ABS71_09300 [bacterium SCN 62-11]|nr:hypothetical protein [Candidatus Eremiobacteraeota bacterium]ODT68979.1 MAG: hypothetical protein ABS71_09300 [bacterium SCN 62-11]